MLDVAGFINPIKLDAMPESPISCTNLAMSHSQIFCEVARGNVVSETVLVLNAKADGNTEHGR